MQHSLSRSRFLAVLAVVSFSCAPSHGRVDPDLDDKVGGGGTESSDVRTMASRMARDLMGNGRLAAEEGRPRLYIMGLTNKSARPIKREMVLEMIQTQIVRHGGGKFLVLDRSKASLEAIRSERRAKREGAVAGKEKKDLLGSDYVLTGTVNTISKRGSGGMSSDYWVYSFKLTDLESSELVWANEYDFKWVGKKPAIYR